MTAARKPTARRTRDCPHGATPEEHCSGCDAVPIAAGWNEINGRAAAVAALWAAWDYFQDRADADCDGDPLEFRPNREMSLQTECEAALRALGESVP